MKALRHAWFIPAVAVLWGVGAGKAGAVSPGDDRAAVIAELGEPRGEIFLQDDHRLYFDRGMVRLHDGRVIESSLMSVEEAQERRKEAFAMATAASVARAAQQASRKAEGERVAREWLANAEFRSSPLSFQAGRWVEFSLQYPEVEIGAYMAGVIQRLDQERESDERERRLVMQSLGRVETPLPLLISAPVPVQSFVPYSYVRISGGGPVYAPVPRVYDDWGYGSRVRVVLHGRSNRSCSGHRPGVVDFPRPTERSYGGSRSVVSGGSSPSWPYDFGTRPSTIRIGSRQPGMSW